MHIPDGFLSPEVATATAVASAAVVGYGVRRANASLDERRVPVLGVTAAFIFAAQMLNFPVAGGTSGHFLGAALAAGLIGGRFLKSSARRNEAAGFGAGRGESWEMATYGGDGFLASDDLEDYESRRYGAESVSSSRDGGGFRDTMPMDPRGVQGGSSFGTTSGAPASERSYASSSRVESEGPAIEPTPIVSAAASNHTDPTRRDNTNTTAPMPATQGSAGASASTSSSSTNVPSAPSAPGNGHTGRV